MSKARSKGQKLAEKRRRQLAVAYKTGALDLAPVPKRHPSGRPVSQAERDPQRTVLDARCRQMGKNPDRAGRKMMKDQMMGDPAGQAIAIGARNANEARSLWQTFSALDKADARYHARILSRSRHAKCGKVEYMPDRFEARPDDQSDHRTDAEKDRDTVNAWMLWHGHLGRMASYEQSAVWDGIYLRCEMHKSGTLTTAGRAFVAAMRVLADVSAR